MATRDDLELEQIRATIANLNAETAKIARETKFPPVVLAAVVIGVVAPVVTGLATVYLLGAN